ncbi:cytochrome c oxidase subunit II [Salisaeta longa]|uniref:cytochrome c oxidase subunit II n=1 Tax=Salisaeta longa TaxID=503170 RepID=UPI0003FB0566|nr:cytochrome c oxidase subunit II [Salisaeta longa]
MHIHKFEKIWIGASLGLIAAFIGIVLFGFTVLEMKVPGLENEKTIDPTNLAATPFADPGIRKVGPNHYEVYMVARQFLFMPGTGIPLTLPADTRITFRVTSPDVLHGLEVVGTNLNATVIPGQITTFTTIFPEPKSYGLICHEYCGPAHHTMAGMINIVPKSEFDESTLVSP